MKEFEIVELGSSMRAAKEYLTVIDRCQTVDEIDVFIESAKRQNRDDVIALAYQRRAILSSQTAVAEGRRPHLNYLEMGLKVDDVLIHAKTGERAKVFSGRELIYKGRIVHISPLERELTEIHSMRESGGPSNHWTTEDGRLLNDLYEETYGPKKNI